MAGRSDFYSHGDWNTICDACGSKYKASELRKRWDGLMVCSYDFEQRQPQDFVRARVDQQAPPYSRPEPADIFISVIPAPVVWTANPSDTGFLSEGITVVSSVVVPDTPLYSASSSDESLGMQFLGQATLAGSGASSGFTHSIAMSETVVIVNGKLVTISEGFSFSEGIVPTQSYDGSLGASALGIFVLG